MTTAQTQIQPAWCIGLMTGTALDGEIDVALLETDGSSITNLGPFLQVSYSDTDRQMLANAVQAALAWEFEGPEPSVFATAEALITRLYARAVRTLLDHAGMDAGEVRAIGGHGLTVLHRPDRAGGGRTRQLLDGSALAKDLGMTVVCDFRSADVAAGGQGAPLAPIYHAALLAKAGFDAPAAFLNLGGVGNLTWWGGGDELVALDTGPANGPVNEWIESHGQGTFDRDGAIAAAGRVDEGRLLEILDQPWFDLPAPKSLDRYDFPASLVRGMSLQDGAATLTALCGASVAIGLNQLPIRPKALVVGGGGRHNPVMMAQIAARTGIELIDADAIGMRGDAVEAECFAMLAMRTLVGLPLGFPLTTGVATPQTGGVCYQPAK
jgi:anhydro-N-acetylmuramic acid kinase